MLPQGVWSDMTAHTHTSVSLSRNLTMQKDSKKYHTVLIIAGSDCSGGAGIQADIKTCTALGAYAMTTITALTAQNTCGVRAVFDCAGFVSEQIEACVSDIRPDAVKIGMLSSSATVMTVAEAIRRHNLHNVVLDPVMVATSGDRLTADNAIDCLKTELIPLADIITPNIPELELISGLKIDSPDIAVKAARLCISDLHARAVLIKGGHIEDSRATDILVTGDATPLVIEMPRIITPNTHGTGCSLSSAIAASLAQGCGLDIAVERAKRWLHSAIESGADITLGHGHGPVNHLWNITPYKL